MTGTVLLMAIALADSAAVPPVSEPAPHWRGRVVVLVPPSIDDDVMRNALARVSGELAAAPFKTITVPIDPEGDIMAQIESAGNDRAATAAFAIVRDRGDPGSGRVTVWVSNRVSGITTVERMHVEGGNVDRAAARLAVETVELVRASLAELWPSPPVSTSRPAIVEPPRVADRARFALAAGFGRLVDLGGAPGFWAPQISAAYGRAGGFGVRVSASGSASAADVSTTDMGSARIRRGMLTIGVIRTFRADRTVQPLIGLGAGVQRLSGDGTAGAPEQAARDGSTITGLATASAGVALPIGARFAAFVEADVLLAWSQVEVRLGTDVATFDRPSLYTHAGLLATF
jgi:hypothetical protein